MTDGNGSGDFERAVDRLIERTNEPRTNKHTSHVQESQDNQKTNANVLKALDALKPGDASQK